MSTRAADSFDEIRANMQRIAASAVPMCPISTSLTLYNCLRSTAKCGVNCPHRDEWIGPDA